jgi:radical SAM protein with 4Fe4S-binding SPASM domain
MIKSLIRPVNAIKAGYSFLQDSLTGKTDAGGMPVTIGIELTNCCNLNCPECSSGSGTMTRDRGYIDISLYNKIIRELQPYLLNLNLYFQGEPMLHPQFFSFIAISGNIRTAVSTNGHFLSEENSERIVLSALSELIISLDGMDQKAYSAYRKNGDIEKVFKGIRNVSQAKKRNSSSLKIVIQFLVNKHNEHQIHEIRRYARKMSASLRLKSMQINDERNYQSWLPSSSKFRRYEPHGEGYKIRNSFPNRCARLWFSPVVTWDGKVLPCCFDKDAYHVMGNLNEDSFREIWNGPKYRSFRKSLLSGRGMIEICRNCTSGLFRGIHY